MSGREGRWDADEPDGRWGLIRKQMRCRLAPMRAPPSCDCAGCVAARALSSLASDYRGALRERDEARAGLERVREELLTMACECRGEYICRTCALTAAMEPQP